jgi:hypothetical protein
MKPIIKIGDKILVQVMVSTELNISFRSSVDFMLFTSSFMKNYLFSIH